MSEKETIGMTEQTKELSPAEKAKKKKRNYAIAKVVVAICVVLCIVLTVFEMGFTYRLIKAVEVEDTQYSVAEYNWLYTNSLYEIYGDLYSQYGQYAAYFLNPQTPLDEQKYSEEMTWHDYIKDYTDTTFKTMTVLCKEAEANGYEMPQEQYDSIDSEWENMKVTAEATGYTVGAYVEATYGRGVNEEVFKSMMERYYYGFSYAKDYRDNAEVSGEEIEARYNENPEDFDRVSFKSYYIDGNPAEGEEAAAAMEDARAEAKEVLEGTKEVEFTEYNYVLKSSAVGVYADWLFDSARVAGDKDMFETETAVYVIEFVEKNDLHYNTVDVRHILVSPSDTADEAAWQDALRKADEYKKEWENMGGTEENFAEVAKKYSADSNASEGGLYENVFRGQMVKEFENWCYEEGRKHGDSEIIKTSYGYHVMFFVGEGEEYYSYAISETIKDKKYSDYVVALTEDVEVSELFGIRFGGAHYN